MLSFIRILLVVMTATLGTSAVYAADAADRAIIGFSSDGKYFAFEEYGVQDGSGFPYSNIYIIELENDKWVEGAPITVSLRDENATTYAARRQALTEAAPLLDKYGTVESPKLLASNAVGEEVPDPHTMIFKRFHNVSDLWTVKLSHIDLDLPPHCQSLPGVKGLALTVSVGDKEAREVYRDTRLPESRGCPENYRLADVIAFGESETARVVVLVHKLTFGFEGRDARFIAIPVTLPSWR